MSVQKREIFLNQNLELFLEPFTLKPKKKQKFISCCTFTNSNIPNTIANRLFSKKKITKL